MAGTYCYMSPEMLTDRIACFGSDLWALGCILYFLLTGKHLFAKVQNIRELEVRILKCDYELPVKMNPEAKDLIEKLLVRDPRQRLGAMKSGRNSIKALKKHKFFKKIDFSHIHKEVPPVYTNKIDVKSFIRRFEDVFVDQSEVSLIGVILNLGVSWQT